jgi:hypothetical protein
VVAKLLSDDPWRRVLLIEAGNASQTQVGGKVRGWRMRIGGEEALTVCVLSKPQDAIQSSLNTKQLTPFDVPFYWTNVANTPSLHWAYPDVNVAKALGGCGIHNAMLYGARSSWKEEAEVALTFCALFLDSASAADGSGPLADGRVDVGEGAGHLHGHRGL